MVCENGCCMCVHAHAWKSYLCRLRCESGESGSLKRGDGKTEVGWDDGWLRWWDVNVRWPCDCIEVMSEGHTRSEMICAANDDRSITYSPIHRPQTLASLSFFTLSLAGPRSSSTPLFSSPPPQNMPPSFIRTAFPLAAPRPTLDALKDTD